MTKKMTREKIVTLLDRRQAAMDRHDVRSLVALHSEDCVVESPMVGTVTGRKAIEQAHQAIFTWFPDLVVSSEEVLIDGDRVAQVVTLSGTDIGGFMGLPPTGKRFRVPVMHLFTMRDDLIVAERRIYDFTSVLMQVGILKAKPAL